MNSAQATIFSAIIGVIGTIIGAIISGLFGIITTDKLPFNKPLIACWGILFIVLLFALTAIVAYLGYIKASSTPSQPASITQILTPNHLLGVFGGIFFIGILFSIILIATIGGVSPVPTPGPTITYQGSVTFTPSPTLNNLPQPHITSTPFPSPPQPTDTPVPIPPSLFFDNFDNGLGAGWEKVNGEVVVTDGELFALTTPALLYVSNYVWGNFTLEFDIENPCNLGTIEIALREQRNGDHVLFRFVDGNCIVAGPVTRWYVVQDDNKEEITGMKFKFKGGHIKIEVQGNSYSTYFNGQLVNQFEYSGFSQGKIYFQLSTKKISLDNISIQPVP